MAYYGDGSVAAWVEFHGRDDTINRSYNISSISDEGTSEYNINFTTSFVDGDYVVFGSTVGGDGGYHSYVCSDGTDKSAGTAPVRIRHAENHNNAGETDHLGIGFIGDLSI